MHNAQPSRVHKGYICSHVERISALLLALMIEFQLPSRRTFGTVLLLQWQQVAILKMAMNYSAKLSKRCPGPLSTQTTISIGSLVGGEGVR